MLHFGVGLLPKETYSKIKNRHNTHKLLGTYFV
jgi:hypothetical protein